MHLTGISPNWGFLDGSAVKNPPAMQEMRETQVRSLGQENLLEEEIVTQFSILAWKIPWTEEPDGLQPFCLKILDTTEHACTGIIT